MREPDAWPSSRGLWRSCWPAWNITLGGRETKADNAHSTETVAARRVDGDGNGLLADAQDRLWIDLNRDGRFDPIGTPSFELTLRDQTRAVRPGDDVAVQPALYTGDGLLIVVAYCGNPVSPAAQEILGARIALMTADGTTLATAHSGFS
jgi:hypothetical protein